MFILHCMLFWAFSFFKIFFHSNGYDFLRSWESNDLIKWRIMNPCVFMGHNRPLFGIAKYTPPLICPVARVAEVVRGHEGPPPKSLDSDKNLSPNIRYIVAILWFVAIYALFRRLPAKKVLFRVSVSWAKSALLHGTYCILCWIESANLQLCAKTNHLSQK